MLDTSSVALLADTSLPNPVASEFVSIIQPAASESSSTPDLIGYESVLDEVGARIVSAVAVVSD